MARSSLKCCLLILVPISLPNRLWQSRKPQIQREDSSGHFKNCLETKTKLENYNNKTSLQQHCPMRTHILLTLDCFDTMLLILARLGTACSLQWQAGRPGQCRQAAITRDKKRSETKQRAPSIELYSRLVVSPSRPLRVSVFPPQPDRPLASA